MKMKKSGMMTTEHNLLHDPIFSVRLNTDGNQRVALPELLALLPSNPEAVLTGMRPFQEGAVMADLVYLAGAVCHRAGLTEPTSDPKVYREGLLQLTNGKESAWCIYVEDLSLPAFLQSPGEPPSWKDGADYTPSAFDVTFGEPFCPKRNVVVNAEAEHWAYALMSQNGQGVATSKYLTTSRGPCGRVFLSVVKSLGFGARFAQFVQIALKHRKAMLPGFAHEKGLVATWVRPCIGVSDKVIPIKSLDPFYIDDPKKARIFKSPSGKLLLRKRPTEKPNKDPKKHATEGNPRVATDLHGATGDLWMPVKVKSGGKRSSMTAMTEQGSLSGPFNYKALSSILFSPEYEQPLAFRQGLGSKGYVMIQGVGFVGSGRTGGWHERIIPIDPEIASNLSTPTVGKFSVVHVQIAANGAEVLKKVISHLLTKAEDGAPLSASERDANEKTFKAILDDYHARIDACFFEHLFERVKGVEVSTWVSVVEGLLQAIVSEMIANGVVRSGFRLRKIVMAQNELAIAVLYKEPKQEREVA